MTTICKQKRKNVFWEFSKRSVPYLSSHQRTQFESEAVEVYSRSIKYLEDWFDLKNAIFKKLQVFSFNKLPTLDDIIDYIGRYLDRVVFN